MKRAGAVLGVLVAMAALVPLFRGNQPSLLPVSFREGRARARSAHERFESVPRGTDVTSPSSGGARVRPVEAAPGLPETPPEPRPVSAGAARARVLALVERVERDPAGALPELFRLAWTEPDDSLRRLGIRLLGRIDLPESRATLRDLIAAEDHPGIRDLARRVLETLETRSR